MSDQPTEREALVVEVGHEELEHGRVRAELRADGLLHVDKRFEGKTERFVIFEAIVPNSDSECMRGESRRDPDEREAKQWSWAGPRRKGRALRG